MTAPASTIQVSIPNDLLRELDETARTQQRSRDDLVQQGIRRVVSDLRWHAIQEEGARRARAAGILTEADVEDLIDSLPDE